MAEREKGWDYRSFEEMASSFYGIFRSKPSSFKKKIHQQAYLFEKIILSIRDPLTAGDNINLIIQELKLPLPQISDEVGRNLLSNIAVELFAESNPANSQKVKGQSLGDLAVNMVIYMTSSEDERVETLLGNPLAHAYGSIEETYVNLLKEAKRIDTSNQGD